MPTTKPKATRKPAAKKRAAGNKPSFGDRLLAAMAELNTPEAAAAAITGTTPPGAAFTVTRLTPEAAEVATLRADLGLTQAAFAAYLNVSIQTVQAWEQGRNPVTGVAARFLAEIRGDLPYWRKRIAAR